MLKDQDEDENVSDNLPDIEKCRARQVTDGQDYEVVECLVDHPVCKHMLMFGYNLSLCRHPRRREIINKTQSQ